MKILSSSTTQKSNRNFDSAASSIQASRWFLNQGSKSPFDQLNKLFASIKSFGVLYLILSSTIQHIKAFNINNSTDNLTVTDSNFINLKGNSDYLTNITNNTDQPSLNTTDNSYLTQAADNFASSSKASSSYFNQVAKAISNKPNQETELSKTATNLVTSYNLSPEQDEKALLQNPLQDKLSEQAITLNELLASINDFSSISSLSMLNRRKDELSDYKKEIDADKTEGSSNKNKNMIKQIDTAIDAYANEINLRINKMLQKAISGGSSEQQIAFIIKIKELLVNKLDSFYLTFVLDYFVYDGLPKFYLMSKSEISKIFGPIHAEYTFFQYTENFQKEGVRNLEKYQGTLIWNTDGIPNQARALSGLIEMMAANFANRILLDAQSIFPYNPLHDTNKIIMENGIKNIKEVYDKLSKDELPDEDIEIIKKSTELLPNIEKRMLDITENLKDKNLSSAEKNLLIREKELLRELKDYKKKFIYFFGALVEFIRENQYNLGDPVFQAELISFIVQDLSEDVFKLICPEVYEMHINFIKQAQNRIYSHLNRGTAYLKYLPKKDINHNNL